MDPGDGGGGPSQATAILNLVHGLDAELRHTPITDPYATLEVNVHTEHFPIKSKGFREWLARLYFSNFQKVPGSQALQDAANALSGEARWEGAEHPAFVRIAEANGDIYVDLGNDGWDVVQVSADGWQVGQSELVRFRRSRGLLALPEPRRDGNGLAMLRQFVNVRDQDCPLVITWLVASFSAREPYPVLVLKGEQGSGKSTAARVLRGLVDPNAAPLRTEPREARDLMIAATNGWVLALENVSSIAQWLSDALCRLSTGGSFATRTLYEDEAETIFDAQRPIAVNGIGDMVSRPDLIDRSIFVTLEAIPDTRRLAESDFWDAFRKAQPFILGSLLDAVSVALRNLPNVQLDRLPRMADFAKWVTAAEPALGLKPGAFMAAYTGNRESANALALDGSPVAESVQKLLDECEWEGTASALLERLGGIVGETGTRRREWPSSARTLSNALRRLAPNLRAVGCEVSFSESHHPRKISIRKVPPASVPIVPNGSQATTDAADTPQTGGTQGGAQERGGTHDASQGDDGDAGDARLQDFSRPAAEKRWEGV